MSTVTKKTLTFEEAHKILFELSFNIKQVWKKCATRKLLADGYESIGSSDITGTAILLIIEHDNNLGSLIDEYTTWNESQLN